MKDKKKVKCPMCGGNGGYIEPVLDYGIGPFERCGYCKGKGEMFKNKLYYQCLGWLSAQKRFGKFYRNRRKNSSL